MIKTVTQAALAVNENLKIRKNSIRGGSSQKRVCIVTGTHGDELEGQYICYMLGSFLREHTAQLDGIVDIYPALNPLGIDSIMRGIPGYDLDMNRTFPGNPNGTMPETAAYEIVEDLSGAEVVIDIHASNIFLREIPQIRMSVPTSEALLPYAKMLNVDYIWVHASATVLESTLAHSLNSRGTKTLVVEMGVGMRITNYNWQLWNTKAYSLFAHSTDDMKEDSADTAVHAILRFMKKRGIISHPIHPGYVTALIRESDMLQLHAPCGGICKIKVKIGETVEQGQKLAELLDPLTCNVLAEITAPEKAVVFFHSATPLMTEGTVLFKLIRNDIL